MSEVILKFKLPEELIDAQVAQKAMDYYQALFEYEQFLRSEIKYPRDNMSDLELSTIERLRKTFHTILSDRGISLFD